MKSISLFLTFLVFAVLSCIGTPAAHAYDPMCEYYEEHNGACCSDCHDMVSCATTNLFCVPSPISTPNSGEKPVVYDNINSQVKGEAPYNGVCEVCHTQTRFHRNNASGDHTHYIDKKCTSCHLHGPTTMVSKGQCYTCHGGESGDVPAGNPPMFTTPGVQSHQTHRNVPRGPNFGDMGDDPGCTGCHQSASGGGVFSDGLPFVTTNACDNCHSDDGAYDGAVMAKANWDAGIYEADGTTLKSGKEQWCATCHDNEPANSQKDGSGINAPNVIGNNSTYGFYVTGHKINCLSCHDASKNHIDHDPRTYDVTGSGVVVNPYADSYRLSGTSSKPSKGFCYVCHNSSDVSHTNFWNDDDEIVNSHNLHLGFSGLHFDSDWDGTKDSRESCITCHNVHGAPNQAMIRHGELISTPGTTDKVPALNFAYLVAPAEFDTATWTPDLAADTYSVYAWWKASPNRATDAKYTIYYDGGSDTVEVNQQINGDQWNLLGTYPFAAGTSGYIELTDEGANGYVIADAVGWDTDGGTPDVIIDNGDAEFETEGDWTCLSGSGGYGDDLCYAKVTPEPDPDASLPESLGGRMGGFTGVCSTCHGGISYLRTPYLGPRVIMGKAEPDTVPNDVIGSSLITVFVSDTSPNGFPDVDTVEIDLTPIGGSANQAMTDDGGGYYSYEVTIPAGNPDSPLTFVITATDDDMNTGEGMAIVFVVDPDSIYVDNQAAQFECTWGESDTGGYKGDYRWHAAGDGSCTATWTPDISQANTYNIYAWWNASPNRATDAKYTVYYDGGSQSVEVNQEINGSQWNYLGNFPFAAGTSGYVVLSDDANQYVIADAIKLDPSPPPPPETVIVDNPAAEFVCTWGTSPSGGYNDDYRHHAAGDGSCTATWTPNLAAGASYEVYAWWYAASNRATNAPYTIYYDGGSETIRVNQQINGSQWNLLGTFPFAAGTSGYVVLSDDANEFVIADAIKWEPSP